MSHLLPLLAELAAWWLALAAFGAAAAPLAARLLAPWPDRGVSLARPLGLLAGGLVLWFGNALGLLGRGPASAVAALAAVALLAWSPALGTAGRLRLAAWLRDLGGDRRAWLAGEALLVVALLGWGTVRAWSPAIRHTEQPTDLMLLNAVAEGVGFPPEDPWLAGEPLAYHDLGHWMVLMLARLAGSPTARAYNLAQAAWLGLLLLSAYGLGRGLFRTALGDRGAKREVAAGLLAAASLALVGNLATWTVTGSPLRGGDGAQGLWWWAPSRAIVDRDARGAPIEAITEFPAFSYLVGDLHAHLLAMPFWLLLVALVLTPWLAGGSTSAGRDGWRSGAIALGSGAFLALDPWQLPGLGLLLAGGGALATGVATGRARLEGAARGALLWGLGLLPFLPWRTQAATQVHGLLVNLANPTSLLELVQVAGTFVPALAIGLALAARAAQLSRRRTVLALLLPIAALATWLVVAALATQRKISTEWLTPPAAAPWLAAGLGLALVLLLARELPAGRRPAVGLAAFGLALLLAPELLFVHDAFAARLNTVFKLGLQAWALLALAASHAAATALTERRWTPAAVACLGLALGLPYLPAALVTRLGPVTPAWSFDALDDLPRSAPGELAAIRLLATSSRPGERVLAAAGESYRVASSLVATATGRPTLLGWTGHELQWRGSRWRELAGNRAEIVEEIYREAHGDRLALLLNRWRVRYVLLGPEERRSYGLTPEREAELSAGLTTVVDQDGVLLLRVDGATR